MTTVSEVQAYKGLASAILLSVYHNIMRHQYFDKSFVDSEWCSDLCEMAGVVHSTYVRKAYELTKEYSAALSVHDNYRF